MTAEKFEALVFRLERNAARDPKGYRTRVFLLAALGYAFILLVLAGVIGLVGLIVWFVVASGRLNVAGIKIVLVLGVFAFVIARALWVQFEAPEGIALRRSDAPALFAMIDELQAALKAPRFHHVLLTDDLNAAVAQRPRLGVLGWQTNCLLVGLPLMQALGADQFRAVLAHEMGHLSGAHGTFVRRPRHVWRLDLPR